MVNLDRLKHGESFIVQKDINNVLAITLEAEDEGYIVLLYQDGQDVIGEYKYFSLEEVSHNWGSENWYV